MKLIMAHLLYYEKETQKDGVFWNIGAHYVYRTMEAYD